MTLQLIEGGLIESGGKGFSMPGLFGISGNIDIGHRGDFQGQYYAKAIDIRDHSNKNVTILPTKSEMKKVRRKRLRESDIKLALSIVGIIEDGLEPDLSEKFREYIYKND